jgi:Holliday junction resolvase
LNSKNKGNRVELELAKTLTKRFGGIEFSRVPMSGGWGTNNKEKNVREDAMEVLSGDIMCPENFIFSIESKSRSDFNFWDMLNDETENEIDEWIQQAEEDAQRSNKYPLIYVKINYKKPFVMFSKKIFKGKLIYGNYTLMRFSSFLEFPDNFFFKEKT